MKAPRKIYINIFLDENDFDKCWSLKPIKEAEINEKYIRADLAKLTTDKIIDIICLVNEVQADIEEHKIGTFRTPDAFAKEVLRRFLKKKKTSKYK